MIQEKLNVLIPDGESTFTLAVIRCLSDHKSIKVFAIYSTDENSDSQYSRFIHTSIPFEKTGNDKDFVDFVKKQAQINNIDVLLPLHYDAFRLFSKYKHEFMDINLNIPVSSVENLDMVNNKFELSKFLEQQRLPYPKTYSELDRSKDNITYPLLYKPLDGIEGRGIRMITNKTELDAILPDGEKGRFIIQEFIKGYDIDCSILSDEGSILAYTIQKEFIKSAKPFAPPDGVEFVYEPELYKVISKLIHALNWTGVMHVDLRFDQTDGKFKIIEINPRFWSSVRASCRVGVNFPLLYCLSSLKIKYSIPNFRHEKYVNRKGLRKILISKMKLNSMMEIPKNTALKDDICDPKPILYHMFQKIEKKLTSIGPLNHQIQNNVL